MGLPSPRSWKIPCLALGLAVLTLLLYARTADHSFINYDDHSYVTDNPHVAGGLTWENIGWAFRAGYAANWHPLTWFSHQLDVQLFGVRPGPMHLVSALLHAANAALLFLALFRFTGLPWRSACVAALFALHPMRVESVAWIAERKDVLSGLFWMLTLLAYERYVRRPTVSRYALVALFLAGGLMAKPSVVTLPCVLLLFDYWPLGRFRSSIEGDGPRKTRKDAKTEVPISRLSRLSWTPLPGLLLEKLPFFALSAAASFITFLVQKSGGAVVALEGEPLLARAGKALLAYFFYLGKLFWPAELFVPYWDDVQLNPLPVTAAVLGLMILTGAALLLRRRCGYLLVGWLWFLGVFVPMIGLVAVGSQSAADRYTYLPSIGLFLALVWAAADFLSVRRRLAIAISAIVLTACTFLTARQVAFWKNSETLFQHTLALDPPNLIAMDLLAWTYATDLDPRLRNGPRAVELATFTVGVTRRRDGYCLATLAAAYAESGQFPQAIQTAEEALALPDTQRQPQLVTDLGDNLELYRDGKAIHGR